MRLSSLPLGRNTGQRIWKSNVCSICRRYTSTEANGYAKPVVHSEYLLSAASTKLRQAGPVRTRFAPSPTGNLHLGSLRTALFNFLLAKATGGQFLLRIEDTDTDRTVPGAEERLYRDLEWAGIQWDEGPKVGGPFAPYRQSERKAMYWEHAQTLVEADLGYRCFCSSKRLHELRVYQSSRGLPQAYDGTCRHIPKDQSDDMASRGQSHVIRLKVPEQWPGFRDEVYGHIRSKVSRDPRSECKEFQDPIMVKSDGFPTYHLANVVDDHFMKITHVVRGSEWIPSTHMHVAMYQAFGWEPPTFAHVGLLLDKDRKKLSKRDGAIDIATYRDAGYFPETVINFVALLGWSHDRSHDIMSMQELIYNASMKYTRGDSVVTFPKLDFMQRKHAARYKELRRSDEALPPSQDLLELAAKPVLKCIKSLPDFEDLTFYNCEDNDAAKENYILSIICAGIQNYNIPEAFYPNHKYFFTAPTPLELENKTPPHKLHNVPQGIIHPVPDDFSASFDGFSSIAAENWNAGELKGFTNLIVDQGTMMSTAEFSASNLYSESAQKVIKKSWTKLVHGYIRWAIAGGQSGPDGADIMAILGREETLRRFRIAKEIMEEHLRNL
ncbi:Glutamate--tRNA ligase mitochondrial [Ciborinia camelliae]|nr:Glutamate--tRNA ligase mitochondrial [Ciborinia camelliae]